MKTKKVAMLFAVPALMFSCGGKKEVKTGMPFYYCEKYRNRYGLYACKCEIVASEEAVSLAGEEATAEARSELSRMLETRVKTMVRRYRERVKSEGKARSGSTLEEVAELISKNYLRNAKVVETKTFKLPNGNYEVCSVIGLEPVKIRMMIDDIARKEKLSPKDEFLLYEELKFRKAQQKLQKELFEYEN